MLNVAAPHESFIRLRTDLDSKEHKQEENVNVGTFMKHLLEGDKNIKQLRF
jgi:hypothetical protein